MTAATAMPTGVLEVEGGMPHMDRGARSVSVALLFVVFLERDVILFFFWGGNDDMMIMNQGWGTRKEKERERKREERREKKRERGGKC